MYEDAGAGMRLIVHPLVLAWLSGACSMAGAILAIYAEFALASSFFLAASFFHWRASKERLNEHLFKWVRRTLA